jgi:hypothetical protein
MKLLPGRHRAAGPPADPISSFLEGGRGTPGQVLRECTEEAVFEVGEPPWAAVAIATAGSDEPLLAAFSRSAEQLPDLRPLLEKLGMTSRARISCMVAEPLNLEILRQRSSVSRFRLSSLGNQAWLVSESFAEAILAGGPTAIGGLPGGDPTFHEVDSPALLRVVSLFCPPWWKAGTTIASVSWKRFKSGTRIGSDSLHWAAACSSTKGRMGFYFVLNPPRGAAAEAVAKAVGPLLAEAWRQAFPALAERIDGLSAPVFGRVDARDKQSALAIEGRLLVGSGSFPLSLQIPASFVGYLGQLPGSGAVASPEAGPFDPIGFILSLNDRLLGEAMRSGGPFLPLPGSENGDRSLPYLSALLGMCRKADRARLVQGFFLPAAGLPGFQALFFWRGPPSPSAPAGAVLPLFPFDEGGLLEALPPAAAAEWLEARREGLRQVTLSKAEALEASEDAERQLWEALRKGRIELSHGGRRFLADCLGARLEALDKARLDALVAADLPLAATEALGKALARMVIDRLSARDLALATFGSKLRRPQLEASLSKGKKAELTSEATVLARRLATGEEGYGRVADAREELGLRIAALVKSLAPKPAKAGGRQGNPQGGR